MRTSIKRIMTALLLLISLEGFSQSPTITGFSPSSGPVGTTVTITGTNLSSPTAFTIGGVSAIVVSDNGTSLVGMVMPGAMTGSVSVTTSSGTTTATGNYIVIATPYPNVQLGSKLVGTGSTNTLTQGSAVAISADGNTAVVGGANNVVGDDTGAIWIYTRTGNTWAQQGPKLVGTGAIGAAQQGNAVAISADGNTVIEGGSSDNIATGAVWVFVRTGSTWSQQGAKLVGTGASGGLPYEGTSVSLSADGNTAIIGGYGDNNNAGAAWIFTRSGTIWTQQGSKLVGTGASGAAQQGTSVAISADGKTAVIGGPTDNSLINGATWVFTRSGSTWTQQGSKLVGTLIGLGAEDEGSALAISADGNTFITGGSSANNGEGAAWIFHRSGTTWTEQGGAFEGIGSTSDSRQGSSVSISADGNTAIVGAPFDNNYVGGFWIYTRSGSTWTQRGSKVVGSGAIGEAEQGNSSALSADGRTAIIGGFEDNNGIGAAWVYADTAGAADTLNGSSVGPDQTYCQTAMPNTIYMAETGTGTWTALYSPVGTIIDTPSLATTGIRTWGMWLQGVYRFVWTTSGGTDTVTFTVDSLCDAAGPNQYACKSSDTVTMAAHGTGTWTQGSWLPYFSGPAPIIANPSSPTTTISGFTVAGIYEFAWTGSGFSDTMTVTVDSLCGGSGGCHLTDSIGYVYNGSTEYTFTAHTSGATSPAYVWKANGQTPIIGQYSANTALLTLAPGLNVISVTITDSATGCINVDSITLHAPNCGLLGIVNEIAAGSGEALSVDNIGGTPPFSYHWSNGSTQAIDTVYSNGAYFVTVTDSAGCQAYPGDTVTGLSNCHLSASVTEYSGNPTVIDTFSAHVTGETGWVSFSWTGTTATTAVIAEAPQAVCLTVRDSIGCTVTVCDTPLAQLSAGPDQAYCLFSTGNYIISLNGSGAGDWEAMPGNPSVVSIWDTTAPVTGASNAFNPGVYGFIRTNGIMSDTCYVTIYPLRNVTTPTATINLNGSVLAKATGSGSWQAIATNPSVANIFHPLSDTTTISGFSSAGSYYFIWTSNHGCQDTMYVQVLSSAPSAGPDQTACLNTMVQMAATGTGIWTTVSSNPSGATILDPTSPTTLIGQFWNPGVYYYIWTSGSVADTMAVTVNSTEPYVNETVSQWTVCVGAVDTFKVTGVAGADSVLSYYAWYGGIWGPTSLLASGTYDSVYTTSFASAGMDSIWSVIQCLVPACSSQPIYVVGSQWPTVIDCASPDTVWPGDADNNKLVDNNDLLTIGLGYDSTGPVRAVQGIVWQGDAATDWDHSFTIYAPTVNFNHADCNGNGVINAADTLAIVTNFGDVHAKTNNLPGAWRSGIPGLQLAVSQDTTYNNDTLTTSIFLGTASLPVSGIYGLAFTFNFDPLVADSSYEDFSFVSSWLGTDINSINLNRRFYSGQVKAAITGIDHTPRGGYGMIAKFVTVITTGNINGKTYSYYLDQQYISDVTAIDQYGNRISLNAGVDTNYIGFFTNGIHEVSNTATIHIYPNPAATLVSVSADAAISGITITDILGEDVKTLASDGRMTETIDISQLAAGVYIVHVSAGGSTATAKLIVSR